jgi:hypothetical protein
MIDSLLQLIHHPTHTDSSSKSLTIYPAQAALRLIIFYCSQVIKLQIIR